MTNQEQTYLELLIKTAENRRVDILMEMGRVSPEQKDLLVEEFQNLLKATNYFQNKMEEELEQMEEQRADFYMDDDATILN